MFGSVRFILAWFVVIAHLSQSYSYSSAMSVYAFYMLSGFLMTLIMNERYHYTLQGVIRYCINRALRIFPQYWILCLLALLFILFISAEHAKILHPAFQIPTGFHEVFANSFIFGLYPESINPMARLVPQAWALHVELVFYLFIGLFLGRNLPIALTWFILSVAYHIAANTYGFPRYSPIYAASIAFSSGCLLYHIKPFIMNSWSYSFKIMLALVIFYLFFVAYSGTLPFGRIMWPFYTNLFLFALCLYQLSMIPRVPGWSTKVDRWLGDLSYPIYLNHWLVALFVSYYINIPLSLSLLLYSIPIILILGYILARVVEQPIEKIRRRIAAN